MNAVTRYAAVYGLLSGLISIAMILAGMHLAGNHSLWFGYLAMLVGFVFIFVGVKRYRDIERGGVIKFLPAFGLGLAIAVVAGLAYAVAFEAYLAATHYTFIDDYIASALRALKTTGVTGAKLAQETAELETVRAQLSNPLVRIPMTFLEIFPVGLIVAPVSAFLLRNAKFLPARR